MKFLYWNLSHERLAVLTPRIEITDRKSNTSMFLRTQIILNHLIHISRATREMTQQFRIIEGPGFLISKKMSKRSDINFGYLNKTVLTHFPNSSSFLPRLLDFRSRKIQRLDKHRLETRSQLSRRNKAAQLYFSISLFNNDFRAHFLHQTLNVGASWELRWNTCYLFIIQRIVWDTSKLCVFACISQLSS